MEKKYGIIKKVYIPTEENQDVMYSKKIGFIIEIDNNLVKYETEQNEENCIINKNDKVEIITQIIDNYKFTDIRKIVGENYE